MTALRERLAQMAKVLRDHEETFIPDEPGETPKMTVSANVAAALVAVADAAADHIDCPLCGLAGGEHDADDECPLARLAAALGVSR